MLSQSCRLSQSNETLNGLLDAPFSPVTPAVQFAKHYETGETLPQDLFEKLCAQRTYMAGSGMLRQLYFGQVRISIRLQYFFA